jgi:predicted metal-dependent hydrolase
MLVFPLFYMINTAGTFYLLWQDRRLFRLDTWQDYYRFLFHRGAFLYTLQSIVSYLKPGFHPSREGGMSLAAAFLAEPENRKQLKEF